MARWESAVRVLSVLIIFGLMMIGVEILFLLVLINFMKIFYYTDAIYTNIQTALIIALIGHSYDTGLIHRSYLILLLIQAAIVIFTFAYILIHETRTQNWEARRFPTRDTTNVISRLKLNILIYLNGEAAMFFACVIYSYVFPSSWYEYVYVKPYTRVELDANWKVRLFACPMFWFAFNNYNFLFTYAYIRFGAMITSSKPIFKPLILVLLYGTLCWYQVFQTCNVKILPAYLISLVITLCLSMSSINSRIDYLPIMHIASVSKVKILSLNSHMCPILVSDNGNVEKSSSKDRKLSYSDYMYHQIYEMTENHTRQKTDILNQVYEHEIELFQM